MKLQAVQLENFRSFEELHMEFHPELTVLVGANGSGKSAILDAVSLALGAYLSGFSGMPSNDFVLSDVRLAGEK